MLIFVLLQNPRWSQNPPIEYLTLHWVSKEVFYTSKTINTINSNRVPPPVPPFTARVERQPRRGRKAHRPRSEGSTVPGDPVGALCEGLNCFFRTFSMRKCWNIFFYKFGRTIWYVWYLFCKSSCVPFLCASIWRWWWWSQSARFDEVVEVLLLYFVYYISSNIFLRSMLL